MNEIVNKFLLAVDKCIRQLKFTYSACRPYSKNKDTMQKLKKTGD